MARGRARDREEDLSFLVQHRLEDIGRAQLCQAKKPQVSWVLVFMPNNMHCILAL